MTDTATAPAEDAGIAAVERALQMPPARPMVVAGRGVPKPKTLTDETKLTLGCVTQLHERLDALAARMVGTPPSIAPSRDSADAAPGVIGETFDSLERVRERCARMLELIDRIDERL